MSKMDAEYWRKKKREQRAKEKAVATEFSFERSVGVDKDEWAYACERAGRGAEYARKMAEHVRPGDRKYQEPGWQRANEFHREKLKEYVEKEMAERKAVEKKRWHCEGCGGWWRATIEIPCVYCDGMGKRKPTDAKYAPVKQLEPMSE